jgi:hypothetical protein
VFIQLEALLKRNSEISTFTSVCQALNGDDIDPLEDIIPDEIPVLKYVPVTSCDVGRSFAAYKHIKFFYLSIYCNWVCTRWQ